MTRIIVDASVLVAGLMANGRARSVLFHTRAHLFAPPFILEELHRLVPGIAKRAGVPPLVFESLLNALFDRIEVVPRPFYAAHLREARERAEEADALGDEEYVALSLALKAPVWTYDHDFCRIDGVGTISTRDVERATAP